MKLAHPDNMVVAEDVTQGKPGKSIGQQHHYVLYGVDDKLATCANNFAW